MIQVFFNIIKSITIKYNRIHRQKLVKTMQNLGIYYFIIFKPK